MKPSSMNYRQLKQLDTGIETAIENGVQYVDHLRGRKACCQDNSNIIFLPIQLPPDFDMKRKDHRDNFAKQHRFKAKCTMCNAQYWSSPDRKVLIDRA